MPHLRIPKGVGTIQDDDAPPMLSISDVSVSEQNEAVFTLRLSAATSRIVTVNFATSDGSARAGLDYEASSGTLTFTPSTTTQVLTVPILDDQLDELAETFFGDVEQSGECHTCRHSRGGDDSR